MPETHDLSVLKHFETLKDPRQLTKVLFPLNEILLVCLFALIAGAESFVDIADYGKSKLPFLKTLLPFKDGIPSHDTFTDVFSVLNPDSFRTCFVSWGSSLQDGLSDCIAIDGKTLRQSFDESHSATHMVSAFATRQRLVLGQIKVSEKSNEITAVPQLLNLLDVEGAIVTLDAMGCQTEIAQTILHQRANYVLALKGNQGTLNTDVREFFDAQLKAGFKDSRVDIFSPDLEKGHGRQAIRHYRVTDDIEWLKERHPHWPGLASIVEVESHRKTRTGVEKERRYFISSLPMDAKQIGTAIRFHWGIENQLHWVLDVVFKDDECRVRKDHGPENFHMMKQLALNVIRQANNKKSLRRRRKCAAWDDSALLGLFTSTSVT